MDRVGGEAGDRDVGALFLQPHHGHVELQVLEPLGQKDHHLLALEPLRHRFASSVVPSTLARLARTDGPGTCMGLEPARSVDCTREFGPLPTTGSFAPAGGCPWTARPCGSCARRVATCPSTASCAATATSSRPASDPEQVVEITLQPLRRMELDAAIVFSDIMVPLAGVGVDVRIEPGRGPVVDAPIRGADDLARLRPLEPDQDVPRGARGDRAPAQGAHRAADRVRRRAVHAGELPGGGRAVAEPRADEGADARRPRHVGRPDAWRWWRSSNRTCAPRSTPARKRCRCSTRGSARSTPTTTEPMCCRTCAGCSTR